MVSLINLFLTAAFAGVIGLGLGGILGARMQKGSDRALYLLLSFSGGVMLSIVFFDLIREALETGASLLIICIGILAGMLFVLLLHAILGHKLHHRHGFGQRQQQALLITGILTASAIALHNIPEGMTLGASFIGAKETISGAGLVLALLIGLHNLPEGMAIAVPLISGGLNRFTAVLITAASGIPTVLGALLGYWMGDLGALGMALSLSLASGTLLFVIFGEILPQTIALNQNHFPAIPFTIGILTGLLVVFL